MKKQHQSERTYLLSNIWYIGQYFTALYNRLTNTHGENLSHCNAPRHTDRTLKTCTCRQV